MRPARFTHFGAPPLLPGSRLSLPANKFLRELDWACRLATVPSCSAMLQPLGTLRLPIATARTNGFRAAEFEVLNGLPQYRPQAAGLAGCRYLVRAAQVSLRRMEPGLQLPTALR